MSYRSPCCALLCNLISLFDLSSFLFLFCNAMTSCCLKGVSFETIECFGCNLCSTGMVFEIQEFAREIVMNVEFWAFHELDWCAMNL